MTDKFVDIGPEFVNVIPDGQTGIEVQGRHGFLVFTAEGARAMALALAAAAAEREDQDDGR